jgi:hypothetical protein
VGSATEWPRRLEPASGAGPARGRPRAGACERACAQAGRFRVSGRQWHPWPWQHATVTATSLKLRLKGRRSPGPTPSRLSRPRRDCHHAAAACYLKPSGLQFKVGDLSLRQFTGRFVTRPKSESACSGPGMRAARQLWRLLVAPRYRQLSGLSIAQMCGYAVATPARMESVPFASCCQ